MLGEIYIEDFNPASHTKHLCDWFKSRGMKPEFLDEIPKIGTIALYKEIGVAAAFLRLLEPKYALIDNLVTNPEALPHLRNEGIDLCVSSIIEKAKKLKFENLFAYTKDQSVLDRSIKYGFERLPHVLIGMSL